MASLGLYSLKSLALCLAAAGFVLHMASPWDAEDDC